MSNLKRKATSGGQGGPPPAKSVKTSKATRPSNSDAASQMPPVKAAAPLVSLLKNDEPIFPRGSGHVLTPLEQKKIQLEAEADVRQEGEFDTGSKTRRTTKLKPQPRKEKDEKKGSQDTIKIESLNFKKLVKGSLVLGQVSRINSLNLEIALPYNLTGHVSIVAISDQLTNRLRDGTSDDTNDRGSSQEDAEDDDDDSRIDLKSVFAVGQYLRVCVLSTMDDAVAGKNRKIELSIRPAEANCGLTMDDIVPYSTVMASIVSVEDRGCIMDLGIPGARAFLPADEIDPAIAPERLQPGVVFLCHASGRRSGSRVAQFSLLPEKLGSVKNAPAEATTINTYLPGTLATLLVSHVSTRGIGGKIMGHMDATADLVHSGAGPDGTDLASTYNVGSKVKVRIICNFAAAKDPKLGVSLLPHVVSLARKHADSDTHNLPTTILPISSLVEECKVRLAEVEIGLYVDTGIAGLPGFVHISRVKDTKVDALYEASGPYQVGSIHRGRVIGYSELDGLFHISFQESILAQQYIRIEDVPIGGLVSCDIEKLVITEDGVSGLIVKIADGVTGLVTERHMSDVRLQHPEKKFRQGMKVKARVLSSDLSKRRMRLTLKKALVNSEAPIIKAFDEVAVGMHVPGTIVKLQQNGAHIRFYGLLQGFLPVSEMSEAYIRNPVDYFHLGQVISVHVLEVDPDRKRLIVSCKDPTAFGLEKQNALKTLQLGELVSAKVTQKTEEHVHVELEGSQLKAILPMGHLTHKSLSKNKFALKRISVGQTLSGLLVIDKDEKRRAIILSQKPSLIQASKDGKFPSSFDDVSIDDILSGYVRNISQTAVFVQFSGSLHALLPRSRLSAEAQSQADFGLKKDDSIMVRVISVIPDLRRIAVAPAESGSEAAKPQDRGSAPADGLSTGSIVQVRISSLKQTQLNVQLVDSKAQGRIDVSQVFDCWDSIPDTKRPLSRFHRNQELRARVIGVHSAKDHRFLPLSHRSTHSVIELTAKPSDLEAETPHPLSLESFKVGDSFIGFVNNVTPRCLWVNVSPNVRGRVSAMDALDDISQLTDLEANFPVGSALKVTVKSVDVQNKQLDLSGRSSGPLKALTWDALKPNMTLPGIVVKVDESQVFIRLSPAISGTLSIPDMVDNYDEANTLDYHKGDICRVSIVEVDRDKKRVRLSTRPSRIMSFTILVVDKEVSSFSHVTAGDLIRGFVKNVSDKGLFVLLGGQITAMVKIRNLSDKFLKNWQDNFQVNQLVKGRVLCVNAAARQIELSLRPSAVRGPCTGLMTYKDVKQGQVVEGKVRKVEEFGAFIVVDKSANVSGLCHRSQMADDVVRDATKLYKEGDAVKAVVLDVDADKRRISFALKPSLFEDEDIDMDSDDSDSGGAALVDGDVDMGVEDVVVKSQGTDNATVSRNEGSIDDDDDDGSSTDKEKYGTKSAGLSIGKMSAWSANAFSDSGSGSDESDESDKDTELAKIMRKRKESKRRKKVEIEVDKTAELDAHGPRTTSDYERLLLGQPDSSELWIAYMVFQMQASELAKAREVAERAIRTINVREETEKLNVWVAYLNLEVTYGNERTVEDVFKRACVYNSDLEVHERLASIYIQSEQWKEADELFKAMVKKFGAKSPGVWINYAHFLHVTLNESGRARSLLPRAIRQLDERHHQSTISRFAALEFRAPHGEAERGRTMFEGLLAAWPKKGDLWNQLLDLETSATGGGDAKAVRDVFERRLGVKGLKPQQAEKWFRRWAAWEENLDPEGEGKGRVMAKAQDWAAAYKARKEEEGGG